MPPYSLRCYRKGCSQPAAYKIAARWSDGITQELKTYSLCCAECLPELFAQSRQKQKACRTTAGETLEAPGIFLMEPGQRDRTKTRLSDLEAKLSGEK
jgi:hypothetical protein